ncbi:MAG: NAD-dependent epimerase/dehydratase family protein, partial [Planctomycetota bacterium]
MVDRRPGAVLVTGGAGYVGAVTARHLAARGRQVVVLDDLSTGHRDAARWGPFVEGDIADRDLVRETIRRHEVTALLHFAAKTLVAESVADPVLYDRWNRGKSEVLAEVVAAEGVTSVVFSSSCAVYGEPREVPIPEDHPLAPLSPYGASKV